MIYDHLTNPWEEMKKTQAILPLAITFVGLTSLGQTKPATQTVDKGAEHLAAQLEEIAMCHHAIKAAHHEALYLNQNPYYRYVMNSQHDRGISNVYPMPERCKNLATDWILDYTKMSDKEKANVDNSFFSKIGMTIPDMATDVQFLTVVTKKMLTEGDKATLWENEDKDIPSEP